MHEPELLARQRQALRAFRQTVAETVRQDEEASKRVKSVGVKARDGAQARMSQAKSWLKEARDALGAGRRALEQVNLAHRLKKKVAAPSLGPGANAGAELKRSAATAHQVASALEQGVQALQQWRESRRLRKRGTCHVCCGCCTLLCRGSGCG